MDRNLRAKIFARIQADRSISLGARAVARAILAMSDKMGRVKRSYDAIAQAAGVDRSTVGRALALIARYVQIHRSYQTRQGRNGGVLVMARGVNLYLIRTPPDLATSHKAQNPTESTNNISIKPEPFPVDPELVALLVRLGQSIAADKGPPALPRS